MLGSILVHGDFLPHFDSEIDHNSDCIVEKSEEEEKIVPIIELSDTQIEQDTVMVEPMYTSPALIAMLHPAPFYPSTALLHATMVLLIPGRTATMCKIA